MMKFLLILLLLFLIYQLWKPSRSKKKSAQKVASNKKPQIEAHPMVQCSACEVFVPKDETITHKGQIFCSEKCRGEYKSA